jgi:hypothetical protein
LLLPLQLHDALAAAGGLPLSSSYCCPSTYLMKQSKAIQAVAPGSRELGSSSSSSQFVGLPLDYVNQPDLSDARIASWCQQLLQQLHEEYAGMWHALAGYVHYWSLEQDVVIPVICTVAVSLPAAADDIVRPIGRCNAQQLL